MPPFRSHSTATVTETWDGPEMKTRVRSGETRDYYAKIFAWYDPDLDEGNKGTYKFIHHMVGTDGEPGAANTNGCSAGIGVLNGGRTGTTIPEADRQGVYDHLAKHIRDAGLEPPELTSRAELEQRSEIIDANRHLIARRASTEVWAIWDKALEALVTDGRHVEYTPERLAVTRPGPKSGRVVRVPIMGEISHRDSFWSWLTGGSTVEGLIKTLREIGADDSVSTVLLDIDSPGGTVAGIPELANEVRRLSASKHVVALANSLAASAAYWIGSQADEFVATPEAMVGSVGVFAVHEDWSAAMDQAGVKMTYITAGKYKAEGNPAQPLSEEARQHLQTIVDASYDLFVADVAKGRAVSAADVRGNYGEGRVLSAQDAKAAGMIDRIAGYDETVKRLMGVKALTPDPSPIGEGNGTPAEAAGTQSVGNSLAAKRLRLDLLEKS